MAGVRKAIPAVRSGYGADTLPDRYRSVSRCRSDRIVAHHALHRDRCRKTCINKKINAKDRAAIAAALESVKLSDISSNLNRFSRGLGYAGKITNFADWFTEFGKAVRTDSWRPFLLKQKPS